METYIAFLRGINVGGHNIIKMKLLQEVLGTLKFESIITYKQSGNIIFNCKETKIEVIQEKMKKAIKQEFDLEIPVLVLPKKEFLTIITENPYDQQGDMMKMALYYILLFDQLNTEQIEKLKLVQQNNNWEIRKNVIYLNCPERYGNTKWNSNFFENKFKIVATARNYQTMLAITQILD